MDRYRKSNRQQHFLFAGNSHAQKQWKVGTLSGMTWRIYEICSNNDEQNIELAHLRRVFSKMEGDPPSSWKSSPRQVFVDQQAVLRKKEFES